MKNDSAGRKLNLRIARRLEEVAQILDHKGEIPFAGRHIDMLWKP